MNLARVLKEGTGWSRNTVVTMLNRMEANGFLERVYDRSVSLLVDTMASSGSPSKREIEELYEILRKAEEGMP